MMSSFTTRRSRRYFAAGALAVALTAALQAHAGQRASIEGGADETGHNYTWTVTNHGHDPIVAVEFTHYMADLFIVPDGWESEMTHRLGAGAVCGVCTATAASDQARIANGQSQTFRLRVGPKGAKRGPGTATIRFADGTVERVTIDAPFADTTVERYAPLIGLGGISVILLAAGQARARKRRKS